MHGHGSTRHGTITQWRQSLPCDATSTARCWCCTLLASSDAPGPVIVCVFARAASRQALDVSAARRGVACSTKSSVGSCLEFPVADAAHTPSQVFAVLGAAAARRVRCLMGGAHGIVAPECCGQQRMRFAARAKVCDATADEVSGN